MPKIPRGVSNRRLVKFLQKHGWRIRPGGKHTVMTKGGEHLTVPRHDAIAVGTVKHILEVAGIDDWSDL